MRARFETKFIETLSSIHCLKVYVVFQKLINNSWGKHKEKS
jgi:hypothetical protein